MASDQLGSTLPEAVICQTLPLTRGQVLPLFAEVAGEEQALVAYEAMLKQADKLLNSLPATMSVFAASHAPAEPSTARRWFSDRVRWLGTEVEDPAERIRALAEPLLRNGIERLVITTAECPAITKLHIVQALLSLRTADLVFGPATNGSLYLLGLSQPLPEALAGLRWDSRFLMDDIREALRGQGWSWTELAPLRIIETQSDWDDFQRGLPR